jgi:hypothetical protein
MGKPLPRQSATADIFMLTHRRKPPNVWLSEVKQTGVTVMNSDFLNQIDSMNLTALKDVYKSETDEDRRDAIFQCVVILIGEDSEDDNADHVSAAKDFLVRD